MKNSLVNYFATGLKGFGMGAANVVPGVSGGTVALITGIYPEIVAALDSLTNVGTWKALLKGQFKEFWAKVHGGFVLSLGVGMLLSILTLAKLMTWVLTMYPVLTWAFFFGLIVASAVVMFRGINNWKFMDVFFTIVGIAMGVALCTLTPTTTPDSMWFIFIVAAISICTMILPGVSGSFILVIFGKYDFIMDAISTMNIPVLAVFALGCVVGLLAFAKLLHLLLAKSERQTMLVLLGFVLGALVKVWPWADMDAVAAAQVLRGGVEAIGSNGAIDMQILPAILCCASGFALVAELDFLGRKKS